MGKITLDEKFKILDRSEYLKIVKKIKDLDKNDIYIPIKTDGKTVYIAAQK